ncbi:citrate lyase subunit beta [Bordetella pertussis]|nr:citrate lyase subunit beta [Bordetella pertussis]
MTVLAARAHGLLALDGVHLDLADPRQIDSANAAFGPSEAEVVRAHAIMAAWQDAQAHGAGVTVVDGMLVEALHVEDAQRVLALAQAIAAD